MIEVRQSVPDARLTILGHAQKVKMMELAEVNWIGFAEGVKYRDFRDAVENVGVLVVPFGDDPYLDAAWQVKVAMCLGSLRPVVLTRTSEIDTVPEVQEIAYVTPPRREALAEGIRLALTESIANEKAVRARKFVEENLTWDSQCAELMGRVESRIPRLVRTG
jgi:glycosyltransferase involved in cell wall biosynthesis